MGLSKAHTSHAVISVSHKKTDRYRKKKKKSNSISSSHACIHDSPIQVVIVRNENKRRKELVIVNEIDRKLLFLLPFFIYYPNQIFIEFDLKKM